MPASDDGTRLAHVMTTSRSHVYSWKTDGESTLVVWTRQAFYSYTLPLLVQYTGLKPCCYKTATRWYTVAFCNPENGPCASGTLGRKELNIYVYCKISQTAQEKYSRKHHFASLRKYHIYWQTIIIKSIFGVVLSNKRCNTC